MKNHNSAVTTFSLPREFNRLLLASNRMRSILPFLLLFAIHAMGYQPPLELETTIRLQGVRGDFDFMAVDAGNQRLFLCAEENNTVEVISLTTGQRERSLAGFVQPKWAVYRAEQRRLYISQGNGAVAIVDSETLKPTKELKFQEKANNLRYDSETGELFVGVGATFGAIAVVDAAKDVISENIPLADFPKQFEVEQDRIFVNVPKAHHIAVIDRTKRKVVETWPIPGTDDNVPMGFDRARHRLFIGCSTGSLVVFDTIAGKSVATIEISPDSDGVHYDAKRHRVYVSCGAGSLDVIAQSDADHYSLEAHVATEKGASTSWFSSELDRLYLAVPGHDQQPAELRVYRPSCLE